VGGVRVGIFSTTTGAKMDKKYDKEFSRWMFVAFIIGMFLGVLLK
jgi:hypothetical protein